MHLDVETLTVRRGGRAVLDGVSFRVASGEALLLTGPNGAGKTTLLRAVAGLIGAEAGVVSLAGGDVEATVGDQCHFVGHLNAVKPGLTAMENLSFWEGALGHDTMPVHRALDRFGLGGMADVPTGYLSAGQKRRLGLARLLVARRPVWLLDEPTVSLDAASVCTFAGIVAEHLANGGIVVAATHVPLGIAGARELTLGGLAVGA